jgi:hypothetical protein
MLKKVVEVVREEGGADVLPTDPARTDIIGGAEGDGNRALIERLCEKYPDDAYGCDDVHSEIVFQSSLFFPEADAVATDEVLLAFVERCNTRWSAEWRDVFLSETHFFQKYFYKIVLLYLNAKGYVEVAGAEMLSPETESVRGKTSEALMQGIE